MHVTPGVQQLLVVSIDQSHCTGDGLCVQDAPAVFEHDIDGLAYVKDASGLLQSAPGATVLIPAHLVDSVIGAADECPGTCIQVSRQSDGGVVAGPDAAGATSAA